MLSTMQVLLHGSWMFVGFFDIAKIPTNQNSEELDYKVMKCRRRTEYKTLNVSALRRVHSRRKPLRFVSYRNWSSISSSVNDLRLTIRYELYDTIRTIRYDTKR